MNEGYIYILTNPSFPEYVKIGYAKDVDARLAKLNNNEGIPFAFRKYATYKVASDLSDKQVHEIIDNLNPDLRAIDHINGRTRKREFYAMPAEDAYNLLLAIAKINGLEHNCIKCPLNENEKQAEELADEIIKEHAERNEIFSFSKCQIPIGAEIEYVKDNNVKCTVVDDRKINYNGETMYMTTLAKMLTGKTRGVAGPTFFSYKGKNLQEYYELYQMKK